jgi:DNA-binding PadR family transcriptional regulator/DNA-directed RNA polymerase subunit RPC12/RpoP
VWLGKFLNLEEDLDELKDKIKQGLLEDITRNKITPLEFTIIETIFNSKELSGYDLILNLNRHFAGTWEAQSGTIYPILSKLKKENFLKFRPVKSPLGPIRKVYSLTEAGEQILKVKVNKNFEDQLRFIENFLVELSSIYIQSFPKNERDQRMEEVKNSLTEAIENAVKKIPPTLNFKTRCSECGAEINRQALYCPMCGYPIISKDKNNKPQSTE